jgi:DNA ligase-1
MALAGHRICVTGSHSKTRKEMEALILGSGAEFAKTCSSKTTVVLATVIEVANATSKVTQARKHGKPIVGEAWLQACLAQGSAVADLSPYLIDGAAWGAAAPAAAAAAAAVQVSEGGTHAHSAAADASQVLLAKKWKDGDDPTGWMMSEKLDGMRAYWSGKNFFSRNGNQLHPPQWFIADMPPIPLDGELWCGRGEFQRCMSIVRKSVPTQDWMYVKYLVFDAPKLQSKAGAGGPARYEERLATIAQLVNPAKTQHCRAVGARACTGQGDLEENLRKVEAAGGEGLMLRQAGSFYEWRRSSTLLKVKTFCDEEAQVLSHEAGKGKNAAVMGALVCRTPDGRQFNVGTGFTDAMRRSPPAIGAIITYRYQELSNSLNPRFPTFVDTRTDLDWGRYCAEYQPPQKAAAKKLKRNHTILFTEGVGSGASATATAATHRGSCGRVQAASPAKKQKRAGGGAAAAAVAIPVVWSWHSSGAGARAKYTGYDPGSCAQLESAWEARGAVAVAVPAGGGARPLVTLSNGYCVDMARMTQHPAAHPSRVRTVRRQVSHGCAVVVARQADGYDAVALYTEAAQEQQPAAYADNGVVMTVLGRHKEWIRVENGWLKERNVIAAAPQTSTPAIADHDGDELLLAMAEEDQHSSAKVRRTTSAAVAAADMSIDIAEDGVPDANQFLLTKLPSTHKPAQGKSVHTAAAAADRGLQPLKLTVPKDGDVLILGRGHHGITDPYMSSRQAIVSVEVSSSGTASLKLQALGRNPCLYRTAATDSGKWKVLEGVGNQSSGRMKQASSASNTAADDAEARGESVLLRGGDELCLLADQTMRYQVVHVGSGDSGVGSIRRALTRSLSLSQ